MNNTMSGTDMLIVAAEGGINYWCSLIKTSYDIHNQNDHDHVTIKDEEGTVFTILASDMIKASMKVVDMYPHTNGARYIMNDDIDAEAADMIFQVACYGKIIYG